MSYGFGTRETWFCVIDDAFDIRMTSYSYEV